MESSFVTLFLIHYIMYTQSNIISAPLIYFFIGIKESVVIIVNKNYYLRNQYKAYPDQKSPIKILAKVS